MNNITLIPTGEPTIKFVETTTETLNYLDIALLGGAFALIMYIFLRFYQYFKIKKENKQNETDTK